MPTVQSIQVDKAFGELRLVERVVGEPGYGQVCISVEVCGVCRTDSQFVGGQLPGLSFPLTPGHEIAGRIDAVGEGVRRWEPGDRATGWRSAGSEGTAPSATTPDRDIADAVWTYDEPYAAVDAIAGHVAFYQEQVQLTVV
ncbi:MAG: alcohol dehydrogenase [Streptomycetaceae bacterium]|nr:alcohol dehydrogenase [Streptomycetaceae bacterium]